jgi:hypothetical protein
MKTYWGSQGTAPSIINLDIVESMDLKTYEHMGQGPVDMTE